MTKPELIGAVATKAGISQAQAEKVLAAVVGSITDALKKGDKISLVGFGAFSTTKRAARKGRNPQTGKEIKIKASTAVKFKAGKVLKDSLNK